VVDGGIQGRCQQVVRSLDGVEVTVEVEVDLFHRNDLGETAAVPASLDAPDRAHARLPQAEHDLLADLPQPLGEAHARRGLALAGLGRRDRGGDDELAVGAILQPFQDVEGDLRLVLPELFELVGLDAGGGCYLGDRQELCLLGYLESGLHSLVPSVG